MLVGIIDIDLFINKKTFLPNPEVMLYSAYHKQNKDIVHLLLDGKNIDMYEKIYIFRNRSTKVKFPEELYSHHNVICRGLYFTNGKAMPIPKEVFSCSPDKSIYDKYCNYWGTIKINGVKTLQRAKYISLRNGFPPQTGAGAVYLYDYDLGAIEDLEELKNLYQKNYFKKINFYYPVNCDSIEDVISWANQDFITRTSKIRYTHTITWKDIYKIQKEKIRFPIEAYFTEKNRFSTQKEIDNLIIDTMNKILYCIINEVKIQFKLNPKIRVTEQFILLKRLSDWSCAKRQPSFFDYCSNTAVERVYVSEFLKNYPDMKEWFYISPHEYRNNGGIWLNDRRAN